MNKTYFTELANYNLWADTAAIGWLEQINEQQWKGPVMSSFSSVYHTALHIVSAEKIWIDFWKKTPNPVFLSREFTGLKSELLDVWKVISLGLKNFVEGFPEEDLEQQVVFRYPRGGEDRMHFWQTLSHVVNHSTYHRGQLVTQLRQVGFANFSSTDLATYYRLDVKATLLSGQQAGLENFN